MHIIILVALVMIAQASPSVIVMTDRGWYAPGDDVQIQVSATGLQENETLWLYLDKPDGHNLYFTELPANGGTVVVPLLRDAPDGTYTVTVTWDHRYVETGFIVESQPIPEFLFAPLVLLVAAFATVAIFRRQASARARAAPNGSRAHGVC